jgi:LuxR family transcriptional regulator, maltose regulon positive regulatory protein
VSEVVPVPGAGPSARLRPPPPPAYAIERTALLRRLEAASAPVSVVCGPAGSGKTTLAAGFAARLAGDGHVVAWVGVDARDDDPGALWSRIVSALRATGRFPAASRLHDLVPPPSGVPTSFLDTVLVEVEALGEDVWLVLDDLHELRTPAALRSIELLLHRAPASLHLVLCSRADPEVGLPRLRLDGHLLELRAADLAFTADEVADCLAARGLQVPSATVRTLHERTEGWVGGVRIGVLALASPGATPDLIDRFDGDDHAVADYLVTEVLARMPDDMRRFLLHTSVCATLDVGLARHLTGRADAASVLERLARENAFTTRLGRGRDVYRYHELLHTFLRAELRRTAPEAERALHAAAGSWLASHGDALHALEHLVAAGDVGPLVDLAIGPGVTAVLDGRAKEVSAILDRLGPRERASRPLALVGAVAALAVEDIGRADRWLDGAEEATGNGAEDPVIGVLAATVGLARAQCTARLPDALAELEATHAGALGVRDHDLLALHHRGIARLATGRYDEAVVDLRGVGELARATGRGGLDLASRSHLAAALASAGRLPEMREVAETAVALAERRGWGRSRATMLAHLCVAWSAHLRGEAGPAADHLAVALTAVGRHLDPQVELSLRGVEALVGRDGEGRRGAIRDYILALRRTAEAPIAPALVASVAPEVERLALDVGEREQARQLAEVAELRLPGSAEAALTRAALAADAGRNDAARRLLLPVLAGDVPAHVPTTSVAVLLLAAVLEARRGHGARSHELLVTALQRAEPLDLVRPFVADSSLRPLLIAGRGRFGHLEDLVGRLLARSVAAGASGEVERLTAAEAAILADLPSLLSVAEIASARSVSVNTVKTHLRAIYRKLGVDSRRAAVTSARHRGLL